MNTVNASHHNATVAASFPPTPRLPVFGWATLDGKASADTDCILDRQGVIYTTSGRASILLAMEQLGVQPGSQVLMPSYHCPTMIAPVDALGAEVVFYPINAQGAPHMGWLNQIDTTRVKLMLAAHFFGLPQPMAHLQRWCQGRGIALIEDCAHALFGSVEGRPVGSWGDVAISSLTKFLPVPEGGCWIANKAHITTPTLHSRSMGTHLKAGIDIVDVGVQFARLPGMNGLLGGAFKLLRALRGNNKPTASAVGVVDMSGEPQTMDGFTIDRHLAHLELTAPSRWLSRQAPRHRNVALRRRNYELFSASLPNREHFRALFRELPAHSAPYVFPLWVKTPDPGYAQLRAMKFPVSRWDRLWPGVPPMSEDVGVNWSHHVLQLACHQDLTEDDIARMAQVVKQLFL